MTDRDNRAPKVVFSKHAKSLAQPWNELGAPRPLNEQERALLGRFFQHEFPGVEQLRYQASEVVVSSACPCGCLTVELRVPESTPKAKVNGRVPVEAQWQPKEDTFLQILLHVVDGHMNELEFVDYDTNARGIFPPLDELKIVVATPDGA